MKFNRYNAALLRLMHSVMKTTTTASDAQGNDLYVVEFPKSGITWLSTVLVNAAFLHSKVPMRATYYNIGSFLPDIHISGRSVGQGLRPYLGMRLIKSHDTLNLNYRNVIYLCRDPYAVLNSYFRFKRQVANPNLAISELLKSGGVLDQWKNHVNGWLGYPDQRRRLTLVRYEDMIDKPEETLGRLLGILGVDLERELMLEALSRSCVESMRNDEKNYRDSNPRYTLDFVKSEVKTPLEAYRDEIDSRTISERGLIGY